MRPFPVVGEEPVLCDESPIRHGSDMRTSLTVSIVSHRQTHWLESCLQSLNDHPYTRGPSEVIVLDNASRPGSMDPIKERFPSADVIEQPRWRGFGANHNLLAREASGELLFILNPDATVHEGTLDHLAVALEDRATGLAAGPILNLNGRPSQNPPFPFPTPLQALEQAVGVHRLAWRNRTPGTGQTFSNGWVSGSAFMIDRSVFSSLGGFDERFFLYAEEVDLMFRLARGGWLIAWVPEAYVTHAGSTSNESEADEARLASFHSTGFKDRSIVEYVRSKAIYMEKHYGKPGAVTYRMALGFDAAIRLGMTYAPLTRHLLAPRGPDTADTRHHHLMRLRAAAMPRTGPSISDLALEWNEGPAAHGMGGR
jgi:N-acetylglucosaminyl-diphospho-decaprenol L-rhamnosyltransferase